MKNWQDFWCLCKFHTTSVLIHQWVSSVLGSSSFPFPLPSFMHSSCISICEELGDRFGEGEIEPSISSGGGFMQQCIMQRIFLIATKGFILRGRPEYSFWLDSSSCNFQESAQDLPTPRYLSCHRLMRAFWCTFVSFSSEFLFLSMVSSPQCWVISATFLPELLTSSSS